jgi:hypothetical protein
MKAKPRASINNPFLEGFIKPKTKAAEEVDDDKSKPNARHRDSLQAEIDRKLQEMREKKSKNRSKAVNDTPFGTEP